jgi:hypothetical protein
VIKSRNQLMDAAYSDDIYVDDRTIDLHIKRLRRKFRRPTPPSAPSRRCMARAFAETGSPKADANRTGQERALGQRPRAPPRA